MTPPCVEIYVYKVRNAAEGASARAQVREALKSYDGFVNWRPLVNTENPQLFVDCVEWQSEAHAKTAGEAFEKDPRTAAFMGAIAESVAMSRCRDADMAAA